MIDLGPARYNEVDWEKLLPDIATAAKLLGYNKASWDGSAKCPIEEYDWDEMSKKQKAAATVLGYTKDSWDD